MPTIVPIYLQKGEVYVSNFHACFVFNTHHKIAEQAHLAIARSKLSENYLRLPDSSVSNIIPNLMPTETWVPNTDFLYLASGMTNSEGQALQSRTKLYTTENSVEGV